jgi:hypothetical protein
MTSPDRQSQHHKVFVKAPLLLLLSSSSLQRYLVPQDGRIYFLSEEGFNAFKQTLCKYHTEKGIYNAVPLVWK